jgi:hypothetical protein
MVAVPGGAAGIGGGSKKRIQAYQTATGGGVQVPPENGPPIDGPVSRMAGGSGGSSGLLPPLPRPAIHHEDAPQQAMSQQQHSDPGDEAAADMSRYEMPLPEGRHVAWDDQARLPAAAVTVAAATQKNAELTSASASIVERVRNMPPWGWLLILGGAVVIGVIIGVIMKQSGRGGVLHAS